MIDIQPGTELDGGKYRIKKRLGRGGQGTVWLADQKVVDDEYLEVALKTLARYSSSGPPYYSTDPEGHRNQLEAEARHLVKLSRVRGNHRFAEIRDFIKEDNRHFIVMEYIDGEDLEKKLLTRREESTEGSTLVTGKAYDREQVIRWGREICEMLEVVHKKDTIHCDIKPHNLIVQNETDLLWLVDWGISQFLGNAPGAAADQELGGTPGYSPPEQFSGKPETRSDVYALAATLYHCLTDDDPANQYEKFKMCLNVDDPVRNDPHTFFPALSELDPDIGSILRKALVWDVNHRITMEELHTELKNIPAEIPSKTTPKLEGLAEVTGLHAKRDSGKVTLTWTAPTDVHQIVVCRSTKHPPSVREGVAAELPGRDGSWIDTDPFTGPTHYAVYCQYRGSAFGAIYFGDGEHERA